MKCAFTVMNRFFTPEEMRDLTVQEMAAIVVKSATHDKTASPMWVRGLAK
jgi:hypothetical protein